MQLMCVAGAPWPGVVPPGRDTSRRRRCGAAQGRARTAVLVCLAAALALLPAVGGSVCQEQLLGQAVYAPITALPPLHPARVVLGNLAVGRCNYELYAAERQNGLDLIAATQATILLLGGESTISLADRIDDDGAGAGACPAQHGDAGCKERQVSGIFSALADDPAAAVKTYNGALQLDALLNSSLTQLAADYCDAHTLYSTVPAIRSTLLELQSEEAELIAVGCPCDISAVYPLGGEEGGGFNISVTIGGLDTTRPKAKGLSCIFNGMVVVPAKTVSGDSVQCVAPSAVAANISANSTRAGEVQLASIEVRGAAFKLSRSTQNVNVVRYYKAPVFDWARLSPGAFIAGLTPFSQRLITVNGANFNDLAGGMYLRLRPANGSSVLGQAELQFVDTTRTIGLLPPIEDPAEFRLEITINSDTWYTLGTIEYVPLPLVQTLTPSTGPVKGNTVVTLTHSRVPFPNILGELETKLGQNYVEVHRVSETQMEILTPARTVDGDSGWYAPGNETLQIYRIVSVDAYTGLAERFLLSLATNGTGAQFSYRCSADEVEDTTCCPAGTAGPGGSNGAFCFPCASGKFAPDVGATACLTCPPNAVSGNASTNCTCVAGYEYQVVTQRAQTCSACAPGSFRNSTMTSCTTCPVGTEVAHARTSCQALFAGCSEANAYQPRNDTQVCCPLGHVLPIPALTCIPCPAGTYFNTTSHTCVGCEAGSFTASPGLLSCSTCANGTYAGARQTSCSHCPLDSTSAAGAMSIYDCTCMAGFARVSRAQGPSECSKCAAGSYMVVTDGESWCDACPAGKWSPGGSDNVANCTCAANFYQNGSTDCLSCPEGTVSFMANNTGPQGIDACACPAGFAAPHSTAGSQGCGLDPCCGGPCPNAAAPQTTAPTSTPHPNNSIVNTTTPAPVTTPEPSATPYCVDGNECSALLADDWLWSPHVVHRCHPNATCVNTFGSYECKCNNGTYGDGFECLPCIPFSTSPSGATNAYQCQCDAGLQCGQEEPFYGSSTSNGTLLPALSHALGGSLTFAFYIQPFSMGASKLELSRGAMAPSLPLSACDLASVRNFVQAASGFDVNARANQTTSGCEAESPLPNVTSGTQVILELGTNEGTDVVRVVLDEQRRVVFEILPSCTCDRCKVSWTSNGSLPLFAWSHVGVVHDEDGSVHISLNGTLEQTISPSNNSPLGPAPSHATVRDVERTRNVVGASLAQTSTHTVFNGKLLDLAIWNMSLTGAELAQLSAPAPRPLLHPEALALRKFSTTCDKSAEWKCIDVDECWANASSPMLGETSNSSATNFTASPRPVCPENSVCTNAWSSYTCSCLSGFFMANGSCVECGSTSTSLFGSTEACSGSAASAASAACPSLADFNGNWGEPVAHSSTVTNGVGLFNVAGNYNYGRPDFSVTLVGGHCGRFSISFPDDSDSPFECDLSQDLNTCTFTGGGTWVRH